MYNLSYVLCHSVSVTPFKLEKLPFSYTINDNEVRNKNQCVQGCVMFYSNFKGKSIILSKVCVVEHFRESRTVRFVELNHSLDENRFSSITITPSGFISGFIAGFQSVL